MEDPGYARSNGQLSWFTEYCRLQSPGVASRPPPDAAAPAESLCHGVIFALYRAGIGTMVRVHGQSLQCLSQNQQRREAMSARNADLSVVIDIVYVRIFVGWKTLGYSNLAELV